MRILIDSSQIPLARTGVGIYAEHLICDIAAKLQAEDVLFVLIQDDDELLLRKISGRGNVCPVLLRSSYFRSRFLLGLYEQIILPWVLRRYRIDLVHSLHYTFPLVCPCSTIVTLHDMTFFLWPQMHTRARRIVIPFFIRMAAHYADTLLFVSEATHNDVDGRFGRGKNLRVVSPLGVDHAYFTGLSGEEVERALSILNVRRPYVLFLGTLEPRKNVIRLVQAFEMIEHRFPGHSLVIAGGLGWHFDDALRAIDQSAVKDRIHRLGYVSQDDKRALLRGCDLLVYPSLYEGFGLPVLEGMAAGVPVITSNVSSLPEVAGEAAVLVDPSSADTIATAMKAILSNVNYSHALRVAGEQRAKQFTWERTANITYAAYRKTCGSVASADLLSE